METTGNGTLRKPLPMRAFYPLIALAAPLALAACGDPAPTYLDQAWVRLSPNKDIPSSGYFVAHGCDADTALRGVLTAYALKVQMTESMNEGGPMNIGRPPRREKVCHVGKTAG